MISLHSRVAPGDWVAAHDKCYDERGRQLGVDRLWRVFSVAWVPEWASFGCLLIDSRGVVPHRVPKCSAYLARVFDDRDLVRIGSGE